MMRILILSLLFIAGMLACSDSPPTVAQGIAEARKGNYAGALAIWQPLADQGDAAAQFHIGYLYAKGLGVEKDHGIAKNWFQKAAKQHHPNAAYKLGGFYLHGLGVEKDLKTAAHWLGVAGLRGHTKAANNLSQLYMNGGEGFPKDDHHAITWLMRAAKGKDAVAAFNLGSRYLQGIGVYKDEAQALIWYRVAADQHLPEALNDLAFMYSRGKGGVSDKVAAYALYSVSAMKDPSSSNPASNNVGTLSAALSASDLLRAQSLAQEMSKPGNLLAALDAYLHQ